MADPQKTEAPTGKRRRQAREKGQVAHSAELSSAAVLTAGLIGVMAFGSEVVNVSASSFRSVFAVIAKPSSVSSAAGLHGLEEIVMQSVLKTVAPIGAICFMVALLANVAQVGLKPSSQALQPQFSRINPAGGLKRLFGARIAFETGKALAKVAVVGTVTAIALVPMIMHLGVAVGTDPLELGKVMGANAKSIMIRALAAYLLIAAGDYFWQKHSFEKSLKMTKQEVRDEARNADLPPEIRAAIRRRQVMQARARMMAAVPTADVIVTNPTHYAVALRYDGTLPAPVVVAKGKNLIAAQIRRIAEENGVPIIPDPPLARSLHASVALDQMIPAELFAAVAQILAHVYRLAGRHRVA